ncbi:MAG: HD domain-containing protein [Syntrophaceae bacterium]|nr:HD domain-containing protein [Syntrophaceae bacterium]
MTDQNAMLKTKLLDISDTAGILAEVKRAASLILPNFDFRRFDDAFNDVDRLFQGKYEGYRACNTKYHDFNHTLMVLLAMARLMHGATVAGVRFTEKEVNLGFIGALMHDTGYIQSADDYTGTGAKYTLIHIRRSVRFIQDYYALEPYFAKDMKNFHDILSCTGIQTMVNEILFESENVALLGKMLGTADLLGQMADRLYLEKLMLLYSEFEEGGVPGFDSEADLLRKTVSFYKRTKTRFQDEFGNVNRYMVHHFKERWNIESNVYEESIENNINYLKFVLKHSRKNIHQTLRRNSISLQ